MPDRVIRVENLGKKYVIGHAARQEAHSAFRDVVSRAVKGLARSASDIMRGNPVVAGDTTEEFWALRHVSFEVRRGDVVGIIGRNGSGKTTLLKVLSRIIEPTEGRVVIDGRVASLLEVGTGFHPELTGRENIHLNGTILGMTRAEIARRFDEIVAFAETERFLDTPVKRYSSGMYLRLAFAVAAHLQPEILIVDEVLAVGDADFQKKCLGKMSEVAGEGRTVLFVSHNMDAVRRICASGLLLSSGQLELRGTVDDCIAAYFSNLSSQRRGHVLEFPARRADQPRLVRVETLTREGAPLPHPRSGDYVKLRIVFTSPVRLRMASVELMLLTASGTLLTRCATMPESGHFVSIQQGDNFVDCDFPRLMLSAGSFTLQANLAVSGASVDEQAVMFEVSSRDSVDPRLATHEHSYPVFMDHTWHIP